MESQNARISIGDQSVYSSDVPFDAINFPISIGNNVRACFALPVVLHPATHWALAQARFSLSVAASRADCDPVCVVNRPYALADGCVGAWSFDGDFPSAFACWCQGLREGRRQGGVPDTLSHCP